MNHDFEVKPLKKPEMYSEGEWEEIQLLKKKATDKFVNIWMLRQAIPYLMKEKIDPTDLEHVLDFFNSNSEEKPPRLGKVSYLEAVRQANRWTELENKRAKRKLEFKEDPNDVEFVFQYEKDRWVKLLTTNAYKREGVNMHHCVGNGGYQNSIIYSLRDEENEPHCTIEVRGNKVVQIKGKTNQLVVHRYHKSLFAFLAHLGIQIDSYDLDKYGFVVCKQGTFDSNTLPDEVELLNDRKLQLGLNSRIPKKLKGSNIEIETRRDLDLSQWEVTTLVVKTQNNKVKLPNKVQNLTIENSVIKEQEFSGIKIRLIDSSVTSKVITFDSISLKNSFIETEQCNACKIDFVKNDDGLLNQSKVKANEINLVELTIKNDSVGGNVFNALLTNKVKIEHKLEIDWEKGLSEKMKQIELGASAKLTIHNPLALPFKIEWEKLYQLDLNGPLDSMDFSKLQSLNAYKNNWAQRTHFIMGQVPKLDKQELKEDKKVEPTNILPILFKQKHNLIAEVHYYEVIASNKNMG